MSVSAASSGFTSEQVESLWQDAQLLWQQGGLPNYSHCVYATSNIFGQEHNSGAAPGLSREERAQRVNGFVGCMMSVPFNANSLALYFQTLDRGFTTIFDIYIDGSYGSTTAPGDLGPVVRAQRVNTDPRVAAADLLRRLPPVPPEINFGYGGWPRLPWSEVPVVARFSAVTMKVALLYSSSNLDRRDIAFRVSRLLDIISELCDALDWVYSPKNAPQRQMERNLVKSFLWSTWSRCLLLHFWYILRNQIQRGYDPSWNELLSLRGMSVLSEPCVRRASVSTGDQLHPYMCRWAFELLKNSRGTLGLDFRHFNQRFSELHGRKTGRCLYGYDEPCTGEDPFACGRFKDKRLVADEQSVHVDRNCNCSRIKWDKKSYKSIKGPVAVSFSTTLSGRAKYVTASGQTMAISHVWSHGHGGRPSTGMNKCLHKRFLRVAKQYGCDSYWIDTLCIPEDHALRKKAIEYINITFASSGVILILDKDIMNIDISKSSIQLYESLFATFLVCDWNVRAWTILEASKGRHALHLLCKNEQILSLRELFTTIHSAGRIDLATLFLVTPLILPTQADGTSYRASIEVGASILSNRHATREGDDIVIWSLLNGITAFFTAKDLWRARIGLPVKTGFLMSKVPRLENVPGFSWAPSTPYVRKDNTASPNDSSSGRYQAYDGGESEEATITPKGLRGTWCVYHFTEKDAASYRFRQPQVSATAGTYYAENPCWKLAVELSTRYAQGIPKRPANVVLIQPMGFYIGLSPYRAASGRGEAHGELFAFCVSKAQYQFAEDDTPWHWITVASWPKDVPVPPTHVEEILIV